MHVFQSLCLSILFFPSSFIFAVVFFICALKTFLTLHFLPPLCSYFAVLPSQTPPGYCETDPLIARLCLFLPDSVSPGPLQMSRSVSPSPFTLHLSASLRYFKGLPCDVLRLWFCRRCHLNSCADSSGWIFSLCFHEWLPDLEAVKNWHISWHGPALLWHMLTQQCQALSPMCKRIVNTSTYVWYSTLPAIKQWHHYGPSVVTTPKEPKEINGPQAISNYQINKKKSKWRLSYGHNERWSPQGATWPI